MAESRVLELILRLKDEASASLQKAGAVIEDNAASFKKVGAYMTGAGAAITGALGLMVKAANDSAIAETQLNSVLKSTGGIAGITAEAAKGLASELQRLTTYDDEAILGAENLLLTFTKIGKNVFPEATKIVLDMSTALGQDLKSSAIQVGKALQDPVLGVTALRRVGVNFNETQVDTITKLVESGKQLEAQKYILKELATEFGGSATAQAKTFGGQLTVLKNQAGDLMEKLGNALTPSLTKFLDAITPLVERLSDWITNHEELTKKIVMGVAVLGVLLTVLGPIVAILPGLVMLFKGLAVAIAILSGPIGIIIAIIVALIAVGYLIVKNWDWIKAKALEIWGTIKEFVADAVEGMGEFIVGVWQKISDTATSVWTSIRDFVVGIWDSVTDAFKTAWDGITSFFQGVWDVISTIFKFGAALAIGLVIEGFNLLGIDIVGVMGKVTAGLQGFWDGAVGLFQAGIDKVKQAWGWFQDGLKAANDATMEYIDYSTQSNLNTLTTIYQTSLTFLQNLWNTVWGAISSFLGPIWTAIQGVLSAGWAWISNLFKTATKPVQDAWKGMWDSIKGVFDSVWETIKSGVKAGINWIIDQINSVINAVNSVAQTGAGALGIKVPSIPTIPRLAKGGVVTSPTVAMIGEAGPEAVVPLSKSGGFGNITVNVTGNQLLSEDAGETIAKQIMDALRINARLAI